MIDLLTDNSPRTAPWGLTVLRLVTGLIFLVHGWQKVALFGFDGFTGFLSQLGLPAPSILAAIVMTVEMGGGLALILGLGTRLVTIPLMIDMLTAMLVVHLPAGFFASDGGYELVFLLLVANMTLLLGGSGALALDNLLGERVGKPALE